MFKDADLWYGVQALDGFKKQIKTVTGNPLLLLWASIDDGEKTESILETQFVSDFVKRAFISDLFEEEAGIRTMSTLSKTFNPNQDSYHNGSFWPKLNGMIYEGLLKWGYVNEAESLKQATLAAVMHFGSPIELYVKGASGLMEYKNAMGQSSCKTQAWSAASVLDMLIN